MNIIADFLMIVLFLAEAWAQCDHGEIRLVDGSLPNEGRVEVCACRSITSCSWGTVCDDRWDDEDAQVVCRQLGYTPDGAMAFSGPVALYGQGQGDIFLDEVQCDGSEATLLECNHDEYHNCLHIEDAGVKCNKDENNIKDISASVQLSTPCVIAYTALITWTSQNTTQHQPSSYEVECFSRQHHIRMTVNKTIFSVELSGLLPTTSYNCCVSAVYGSYTARTAFCTKIVTTMMLPSGVKNSAADTIGGVLGFIIAILLILLAVSGIALVYLLRPRLFKRVLPKHHGPDRNSTDVPVRRNVSYANTAYSATSGAQGAAGQNETDSAAATDYSRIGPSYETIDSRRQQPAVTMTGRDQVSQARLSERYEFSESHLAAMISAGGSGAGDRQGNEAAAAMDYEVPLQSGQHEEYSHLQR